MVTTMVKDRPTKRTRGEAVRSAFSPGIRGSAAGTPRFRLTMTPTLFIKVVERPRHRLVAGLARAAADLAEEAPVRYKLVSSIS